jgi:hypothetical protein
MSELLMRVIDSVAFGDILARANAQHLYLKSVDLRALPEGRGVVEFTENPHEARRFDDFMAVIDCWRQVNPAHPVRDDGKPNRPLTSFTIEPVQFTQAALLWDTRR